jgi:hypothetical protein
MRLDPTFGVFGVGLVKKLCERIEWFDEDSENHRDGGGGGGILSAVMEFLHFRPLTDSWNS